MPMFGDEESANDTEYINPFDDNLKRRSFIIKIYTLVFFCICVTVVHVALVLTYAEVRNFLNNHFYIVWIAFGAYFITGMIYSCCQFVLRSRMAGPIVLMILVESLSIICAVSTMHYETHIILLAAIGTAGISLLITIVAIFVPFDMTKYTFILRILGGLLLMFVLTCFVIGLFVVIPILELIAAFATVFVFSIYMLYSTQLIIGGKKYQLSEKDYISGAIALYVDVITIFLALLQIFQYFNE